MEIDTLIEAEAASLIEAVSWIEASSQTKAESRIESASLFMAAYWGSPRTWGWVKYCLNHDISLHHILRLPQLNLYHLHSYMSTSLLIILNLWQLCRDSHQFGSSLLPRWFLRHACGACDYFHVCIYIYTLSEFQTKFEKNLLVQHSLLPHVNNKYYFPYSTLLTMNEIFIYCIWIQLKDYKTWSSVSNSNFK